MDVWIKVENKGEKDSKTIKQYEQCVKDWVDFRFAEKDCLNL